MGFCNYEEFESPDNRGQYNWTESIVSDQVQNLGCFYGAQIEENMDARATRRCTNNLQWADYDESQCASQDTNMLRILGRVTLLMMSCDQASFKKPPLFNIHCYSHRLL